MNHTSIRSEERVPKAHQLTLSYKVPSSRPCFVSLVDSGIHILLYLVLGWRPIQCIRLSVSHIILYLRLVLLMNFRIIYCNETKQRTP